MTLSALKNQDVKAPVNKVIVRLTYPGDRFTLDI